MMRFMMEKMREENSIARKVSAVRGFGRKWSAVIDPL